MKKIVTAVLLVCFSLSALAQFGILKDKVLNGNNSISKIFKKPAPITTNFKDDVKMEGSLPATYGNDKKYVPLYKMKQTEEGAFILCPGYYEMINMSYCLQAGTHGPSNGDGYMYAPTAGKMHDIVNAILLKHATKHQEISQHDVQVLLWAIIARAKFKNLSGRLKVVAALLLTPEEIVKLNGGVAQTLGGEAIKKGIVNLPAPIQSVMEAENNIRLLVEQGSDSYEDFERYAMLAGIAPDNNSEVVRGMWSLHPDGYYVRYFPEGYSRTRVQLWVPDTKGQIIYNAIGTIACPASTGAQRLAQTNIPLEKPSVEYVDPCGGK